MAPVRVRVLAKRPTQRVRILVSLDLNVLWMLDEQCSLPARSGGYDAQADIRSISAKSILNP